MPRYSRDWIKFRQRQACKLVACPSCDAKVGMPCVTFRKMEAVSYIHVTRINKYNRELRQES